MSEAVKIDLMPDVEGTPNGVKLDLTAEQRNKVVMSKYVNTDSHVADWEPEGEWIEEITADLPVGRRQRPRFGVEEDGETRSLNADDSLIIGLIGTPTGIRGIVDGMPVPEEEAENREDLTGQSLMRVTQWDFRISYILKTNGLQERIDLHQREDTKRKKAEERMFDSVSAAFAEGLSKVQGEGGELAPSADQLIKALGPDRIAEIMLDAQNAAAGTEAEAEDEGEGEADNPNNRSYGWRRRDSES